jgi:hypothetical protein
MKLIPAEKNSHVAGSHHDGQHLIVQWGNGTKGRYLNCPASHHDGMHAAESPGKYLYANVKNNFKYEKIE